MMQFIVIVIVPFRREGGASVAFTSNQKNCELS